MVAKCEKENVGKVKEKCMQKNKTNDVVLLSILSDKKYLCNLQKRLIIYKNTLSVKEYAKKTPILL